MKDQLLREAKIEALKNNVSLTAFIEEAVKEKLNHEKLSVESVNDYKIITFKGNGTQPGVNLDSSGSLLDLMEN